MATIRTTRSGSMIRHIADYADPRLDLDLTSDRWNLTTDQSSVKLGVDVTEAMTLRPDRGRKPVGVNVPEALRPICCAGEITMQGNAVIRWRDLMASGGFEVDGAMDGRDTTGYSGTYTASNGQYDAGTNAFQNYTFRRGDRFTVTTASYRGSYEIISKVSNDVIEITHNLQAGDGTIAGIIERFPGLYEYADSDSVPHLWKNYFEYQRSGPWPADVVDATLVSDDDERNYARDQTKIDGRTSRIWPYDSIALADAITGNIGDERKASIVYTTPIDRRGIWMSNGQKFWLVQGGELLSYFNLADAALGTRWRSTAIARDRVMFTSPKYPPRVVNMAQDPSDSDATSANYAGLLKPELPEAEDLPTNSVAENRAWRMSTSSSSGSLSAGEYRVKVRAVNIDEDLASEFVDAYVDGSGDTTITVSANDAINVYTTWANSDVQPPPIHERWTHIEVWRTQADGSVYHLETRMEVVKFDDLGNENYFHNADASTDESHFFKETPNNRHSCELSDQALSRLPIMTVEDETSGRLPPVCQEAINLNGVILCAGKASEDVQPIEVENRNFDSGELSYKQSSTIHRSYIDTNGSAWVTNYGTAEELQAKDYFVIIDGGTVSGKGISGKTGRFLIDSIRDNNSIYLRGLQPLGDTDSVANSIRGYITRAYEVEYPKIEEDNEVHYSRTDQFGPEDFSDERVLRVGDTSDEFKRLVQVGNYGCMIMRRAVHLIYPVTENGVIRMRSTRVATPYSGTPWGDSVVVAGDRVYWLNEDGIMCMVTSDEPDETGRRAYVFPLDDVINQAFGLSDNRRRFRKWIRDAIDNDYAIDAGMDQKHSCIRWRKKISDNEFQSLQYSYRTQLCTLLDDDSGIAYVNARFAEAGSGLTEWLYSVTEEGAVLRVNNQDTSDHYENNVLQSLLRLDCKFLTYRELDPDDYVSFSESGDRNFGELGDGRFVPPDIDDDRNPIGSDGGIEVDIQEPRDPPILIGGGIFVEPGDGDDPPPDPIGGAMPFKATSPCEWRNDYIKIPGAFNPAMVGEPIRFRSTMNPDVHDAVRIIRRATRDRIDFDPLHGLKVGDEFIIASNRFRVRFAPVRGVGGSTVKKLEGWTVRPFVGERHFDGWQYHRPARMRSRVYREYRDRHVREDSPGRVVVDHREPAFKSEHSESPLHADGEALELEVECVESRTDFKIEQLRAVIVEELDYNVDNESEL